jgi:hypothetical protein
MAKSLGIQYFSRVATVVHLNKAFAKLGSKRERERETTKK